VCIPNFPNGTGTIVQCADGTYSHSGGRQGACSHHGGEARWRSAQPSRQPAASVLTTSQTRLDNSTQAAQHIVSMAQSR
jgi:hypothetical protein